MREFDFHMDMNDLDRATPCLTMCALEVLEMRYLFGMSAEEIVKSKNTDNHLAGLALCFVLDSTMNRNFFDVPEIHNRSVRNHFEKVASQMKKQNFPFNIYL